MFLAGAGTSGQVSDDVRRSKEGQEREYNPSVLTYLLLAFDMFLHQHRTIAADGIHAETEAKEIVVKILAGPAGHDKPLFLRLLNGEALTAAR